MERGAQAADVIVIHAKELKRAEADFFTLAKNQAGACQQQQNNQGRSHAKTYYRKAGSSGRKTAGRVDTVIAGMNAKWKAG
jgi:hypothetical protein